MLNQKLIESVLQSNQNIKDLVAQSPELKHDLEQFATQIVGETVLAILTTDTRSVVYTTFDRSMSEAIIAKVVDHVRNHWSLPK